MRSLSATLTKPYFRSPAHCTLATKAGSDLTECHQLIIRSVHSEMTDLTIVFVIHKVFDIIGKVFDTVGMLWRSFSVTRAGCGRRDAYVLSRP